MIIGDGIMLGAGGETASIFVTGLSETDTVTASKDGKTVVGKWTKISNPASVVPDGYMQLEYIESTGTQYIDTGYTPTSNTIWETDFQFVGDQSSAGKDGGLIGSYDGGRFHFGYLTGSSWHMGVGNYGNFGTADNNRHLFVIRGSGVCSVDETNYTISNASVSGGKIWLFNWYHTTSSLTRPSVGKLYSTKISENERLIHELIPVKRLSDNTIGLYDKVESKFYSNSGTGTFTAGPEIPQNFYGFLIDKIKDYGTYTVTATNGTKTATQDVLVDSATQYDIELSYKLWLYKDGVPNDFINFHLYGTPASYGHGVSYAGKRTANKVDLSKYTKIGFSCPQLSHIVEIYTPNALDVDSVYSSGLRSFSNTLSDCADISTKTSERYIFIGIASHWDNDTMSVVDYDTYFQTKHSTDSTLVNYINEVWLE